MGASERTHVLGLDLGKRLGWAVVQADAEPREAVIAAGLANGEDLDQETPGFAMDMRLLLAESMGDTIGPTFGEHWARIGWAAFEDALYLPERRSGYDVLRTVRQIAMDMAAENGWRVIELKPRDVKRTFGLRSNAPKRQMVDGACNLYAGERWMPRHKRNAEKIHYDTAHHVADAIAIGVAGEARARLAGLLPV